MTATFFFFSTSTTYRFDAWPICWLVGALRKHIGYFFTSVRLSTQQGWICRMFCRARIGTTASDSPELSGPNTTLTLAARVSSAVAFTALVGSDWVSRWISSIMRPLMPPALLISCTASSVPRLMPTPVDDEGPVSAGRYPTWIGPDCAMAGLAIPAAAAAAAADFKA